MPEEAETMPKPHIYVERTLAVIKPDAVHHADEIEDIITQNGFSVLHKRKVQLTPEQASELYSEHFGKMFFPSLITYMSSGPIVALVIAKDKAISSWRELIGPTNALIAKQSHPDSLRAKYGTDDQQNALHGSDSFTSAEKEIRFFFPDSIVEPISIGDSAKSYLARHVNPTVLKGLTELCKKKPNDPIVWLSNWLLENNPNKPKVGGNYSVEEPQA
ncbi:hypothetical protein BOX15_Mlig026811g3 [Macrostomum lignano]|uniref:Uncharacterized protein n=2 Tax=Macrostomum lignano TaxID=282301 RepID=A0A267GNG9_9PLAT|nr:hypothetical protein BOX15_Mlig026811g3 [Macrostomum lignano]